MIQNIIETDVAEASELLSINWALFLTFLGLVPASVIIKCQLKKSTLTKALIRRTAYLCGTLILLIINILPFYQDYASVLRTNREL
jgi:lipid A ethanolaminephosphotransferase